MNGKRIITKTEGILLGLTAVFLCGLLVLSAREKTSVRTHGVETDTSVPQETFMPDLSPLNVNIATAAELEKLPGIGEELAERIVAYRTEHGAFESVEQLLEVPGIGEGKLAAMDGRITVLEGVNE